MVRLWSISGSPLLRVMVPVTLKLIVSPEPALRIASRSAQVSLLPDWQFVCATVLDVVASSLSVFTVQVVAALAGHAASSNISQTKTATLYRELCVENTEEKENPDLPETSALLGICAPHER
jgi:hypothetical protein